VKSSLGFAQEEQKEFYSQGTKTMMEEKKIQSSHVDVCSLPRNVLQQIRDLKIRHNQPRFCSIDEKT